MVDATPRGVRVRMLGRVDRIGAWLHAQLELVVGAVVARLNRAAGLAFVRRRACWPCLVRRDRRSKLSARLVRSWGPLLSRAVGLSEGEDVRFDARVEECDLERAIRDRPVLAHQLIEPWLDQRSPALLVDVQPMGCAGRCAVDQHAESDGRARSRAQDEMDVARMEAKAIRPPASFRTHARPSIVQFPARAQVLSCNDSGAT